MRNDDGRRDDMSVQLFEIRCSVTDPAKCVLYVTRGGIGCDDDSEDPWMWLQECYHCQYRQFIVTPFLHTRRKFGPGIRQSGNDCRKLSEYTDGKEPDETDLIIARVKNDLENLEKVKVAAP